MVLNSREVMLLMEDSRGEPVNRWLILVYPTIYIIDRYIYIYIFARVYTFKDFKVVHCFIQQWSNAKTNRL